MDKNRVKGMLWGLIVGDCIGSPIQFSGKDSHPWITDAAILDDHLAGVRSQRGPGAELTRALVPNSGWAVATLQAAEWAFNTTETFADGMIAAINLGGDSDSIGAVYGQIAGAYYGFDAIPADWIAKIHKTAWVEQFVTDFVDRVC